MIFDDLETFAEAVQPMTALAGLDFGEKTIGVAVSDTLGAVATPLQTIRRKKFTTDAAAVVTILEDRAIGGLILGLPRNMDGS